MEDWECSDWEYSTKALISATADLDCHVLTAEQYVSLHSTVVGRVKRMVPKTWGIHREEEYKKLVLRDIADRLSMILPYF